MANSYESSATTVLSHKTLPWTSSSFRFFYRWYCASTTRLFTDDCSTKRSDPPQSVVPSKVTWMHGGTPGAWNLMSPNGKFAQWSERWNMYPYRMEGWGVKSTSSTPYLGVTVNSVLTSKDHIDGITNFTCWETCTGAHHTEEACLYEYGPPNGRVVLLSMTSMRPTRNRWTSLTWYRWEQHD